MRIWRGKGAQVRTSEEEKEHRYEHQKRNCPEAERVASAEAVQRDLLLVLDDFHLVGRSSIRRTLYMQEGVDLSRTDTQTNTPLIL